MSEKLKINDQLEYLLFKKKIAKSKLAEKTGMTANNMYNKFKRNSFSIEDLQKICDKLECTLEISVTINDTGERIYLVGE